MRFQKNIVAWRQVSLASLLIAAIAAVGGCNSTGDGFRAQELPSKAELQKQIDTVTASTSVPPSAKPNIIAGLKRQMESAK